MNLVNLTNHEINELTTGITIPPSGIRAEVATLPSKINTINNIPVFHTKLGDVIGLPEPQEDTIYIVSSLVLNSVPKERTDVVAPGNARRNNKKQVIGCMGFKAKDL
jgi:hypothetical protein